MKYFRYVLKKLLGMIPIILIVSAVVFFLLRMSGVDPVTVMIGEKQATDELRESLKTQFNLDKPLLTQYWIWLKGVLTGDLGVDYINKQSIQELIVSRLPVTVGLVIMSSLFGMTFAIILGVIAALNRNKPADHILSVVMLFLTSVPNFVVSILVIVFCSKFIPGYSFVGAYSNFGEFLQRIFVPSLVMSLGVVAMLGRITRSSMISQLQAPHIITARAKGMDNFNVTFKHAFHNAVIPVITIAGLQFAGSVGGTVLIEQIFSLPGVGGLLISGIQQNNYPVVQILVLFMLVIYLVMSFVVDMLYAIIDPRVKLG
ncbi:ABC transporter permease [Huintestinicola butyrica]|jgi:peptide/nickel transport system permease protein|uniref:ABC transporter permease n=1 Tax=Huintestinicola butyrica TaxID=2981728 RepID=UPI003F81AE8D